MPRVVSAVALVSVALGIAACEKKSPAPQAATQAPVAPPALSRADRLLLAAATVIVALIVGSNLLGMIGAILAVPTAAIVQVLVQEYLEREDS